ncbi:hypothetical protein [Mucilaginibacter sp.]|uniref:hypothetical protein n=1 Tax=Mucilaginibacter sp. TaxID=1882438 RepID=UPI00284F6BCC|nr:hypothetical protein [Mucilaginibacter sp.]MDR3696347.1 hypothetical protein [Mucilaginibacter sp.]
MKNATIIFSAWVSLVAGSALAQQSVPAEMAPIQKNFNDYHTNSLQEKLFVHTNRNSCTAGELLWFKVYNVDGIYLRPLNISKVVYVEVLDINQNPVLQTKIAMKDDGGDGSLFIPLTVPTGNYTFRAYTNWMKNFSPDYYFSKKITIINPLKSPGAIAKTETTEYDIQFFPEGGELVKGLASVIGFKAADQWGKGLNFKGAILNENNDTVARFAPLKFGLGHFTFKPENLGVYHAVIKIDGKEIQKKLPVIYANGYVVTLTDNGSGTLSVKVNSNLPKENLYLFAQTRNVVKLIETAVCDNGTANFTIDKGKLGDGISQITIFNGERSPVCERLYFKRPQKQLMLSAETNVGGYGLRKKVDIAINSKTQNGTPAAADLSVSVYRLDALQYDDKMNILNYLWLSSDLKGTIESPAYYFNSADATSQEAADNLMLTQGWRSFTWKEVYENKPRSFTFLPEFNGPIVTAKINNQLTQKPANGIFAYLGIPGKSVQLYASRSDSLGRLTFNMKPFYGPSEIIAETNTEIDTNYHIDILSPFSEQFAKVALPRLDITPAMETSFEDQSLAMQVQNIYNAPLLKQFNEPRADSSAFYGGPTKTYLLDNYTRFTTIEEIMREYVREVNVSRPHDQFRIKVIDGMGFLSESDPLVLVDGVPFFKMNKVFTIDPLKLRKLEVVPHTYYLGPSTEQGIFSFTSYKGDFGGAEIDPHAVVIDYEGLQMQRQFYAPEYDTEQKADSRIPDFRAALYWSPSVATGADGNKNVSFYSSDLPGKYIGVIQGITKNGDAGSQTFTFEVKPNFGAQTNK